MKGFLWLRPGYVQVGTVYELKFASSVGANFRVKFFRLKDVRLSWLDPDLPQPASPQGKASSKRIFIVFPRPSVVLL